MAQARNAAENQVRLMLSLVPAEVRKSISQDELTDRLVHAADLTAKARGAADPVVRKGYENLARATLAAQPRAVTERQVADLVAKAARSDQANAEALRRRAAQVAEDNPSAPRRRRPAAVTKAARTSGDDELVPVFDAGGKLTGVCPRSSITPVASPAELAKARRAAATRRARP